MAKTSNTLFELTDQLATLLGMLDDSDGEVDEVMEAELDAVGADVNAKVDGIARLITELKHGAQALEAEAERLAKRAGQKYNAIDRLKAYIKRCLTESGIRKVTTDYWTVFIKNNSRPTIKWTGQAWEAPEEFQRTKIEIDGDAAYKAYKEHGVLPDGFQVTHGDHLEIK